MTGQPMLSEVGDGIQNLGGCRQQVCRNQAGANAYLRDKQGGEWQQRTKQRRWDASFAFRLPIYR
ncbi:hypothetical protein GCM10011396_00110 [Undibacterium terreum]|uniref:Uncharacterized protein n=1 Tax=Undibacterium terreum TaxID=1224302 RepID=A0A916U375_9BURK|nr:hypothetical protein GCM10011396_00110 [Undibacterium terreum]